MSSNGSANGPDVRARRWDVRLLDARSLDHAGLLRMSAGVAAADSVGESSECVPGAWVPRMPWRRLTLREIDDLSGSAADRCVGQTIEILTPGSIGAPVRERRARLLAAARGAATDRAREAEVVDLARQWLDDLLRRDGLSFQFAGALRLGTNPPGRRTSTTDPQQGGRRLGMHVDSHERRSFDDRQDCRRLLSLNVSSEAREFLFVPVSVGRICDVVRVARGARLAPRGNATDLAREFFAMDPAVGVVAVKLAPGDAYLAPVQNLPHDGSTAMMATTDLTVRAFGEFFPIGEREPVVPPVFAIT